MHAFLALSTLHVEFCCIPEYLSLNSNVIMLLTSCINFHKNVLHIKVFIPILKVAGQNFWIVYFYWINLFLTVMTVRTIMIGCGLSNPHFGQINRKPVLLNAENYIQ